MTMRYWSVEESAQLLVLSAEGKSDRQIGNILGRSIDSVYARRHAITRPKDVRPRHDARKTVRAGLPPGVLEEAERVENSPVTLSMALCGDPREGRSALDRQYAGISEPGISARRRPTVSLGSFSPDEVRKYLAFVQSRFGDDEGEDLG